MSLISTSFLSFIATAVKLLSMVLINKLIAIYVGPTGLALIGQFQNFNQIAMTLAQGAITGGVTKYVAEYGKDNPRLPILLSTSLQISIITTLTVSTLLYIFADNASLCFLNSFNYTYIFIILSLTMPFFVINNLLLSIINGLQEIRAWVNINVIQNILSLIITSALIYFFSIDGALISLVASQSVVFFVILWFLKHDKAISAAKFMSSFDVDEAKKLGRYALMAFTSIITIPLSQMIVRNYLGEKIGWDNAGYWQGMLYISNAYLMVVTTTLSVYYLPKLSTLNSNAEIRNELVNGYKFILPVVFFLCLSIYFLRGLIVWVLFAKNFEPIIVLFKWQLIGDFLKLASWLMAYIFIAKAMTTEYIVTEILFSFSFTFLSIIFVSQYGLLGVSYSHSLNYLIYFLIVIVLTKKKWSLDD